MDEADRASWYRVGTAGGGTVCSSQFFLSDNKHLKGNTLGVLCINDPQKQQRKQWMQFTEHPSTCYRPTVSLLSTAVIEFYLT